MKMCLGSVCLRGFHSLDRQAETARGDLGVGWGNASWGRGVGRPVGVTIRHTCCCVSPCCRSVEECCRFPPLFFSFMFQDFTRVVACPACDECGNGASESAWKGCDGDSVEPGWQRNAGRGAGATDCVTSSAASRKFPILEHLVRLRIMDRGGRMADSPAVTNSIMAQPPHLAEVQTYAPASGETREAQFLFALELFQRDSRERINKSIVGSVISREHNEGGESCASGAFERGWGEELWRQDPLLSCCVSAVHCLTRLLDATRVSNSLTSAWSTRKRSNEQAERSSLWLWRAAGEQANRKHRARWQGRRKEGKRQ